VKRRPTGRGAAARNVQARHELARDLGDGGLMRVFRLLVRAAEADKSLGDFFLLGVRKAQLGFVCKILGDGIRAEIDAARINLALLKKEEVARLGADVEEHGAIIEVGVIITKRVAESGG
jgi:hypothetical protein